MSRPASSASSTTKLVPLLPRGVDAAKLAQAARLAARDETPQEKVKQVQLRPRNLMEVNRMSSSWA
jgi:hypothetical protein